MARKEHYIPKHYLEGFVDPSSIGLQDPYLWVVDLLSLSLKSKAPKKVAKISGFYDSEDGQSFEDHLTKIENKVEPVFKQFRKRNFLITEEDRFHLSVYMGLQIVRTPYFRNVTKAVAFNFAKESVRKIFDENDDGIELIPPANFDEYAMGLDVKMGIEFWAPLFFAGKWLFAISPSKVKFITSDSPIVHLTRDAKPIIDKNLQIWFPVSLDCGLFIDYSERPNDIVDEVSEEIAESFNRGILDTSSKYIFCSSQQIGREILKYKRLV